MNKKQLQEIRNNNYRDYVDSSKSLAGESNHPIMRYNCNNSAEHEEIKLRVCRILKKHGHKLLTECYFKNGSRADIFDLDTGTAYEIIKSESKASIKSKQEKYPVKIITIEV